jgi:hypothetical protein
LPEGGDEAVVGVEIRDELEAAFDRDDLPLDVLEYDAGGVKEVKRKC